MAADGVGMNSAAGAFPQAPEPLLVKVEATDSVGNLTNLTNLTKVANDPSDPSTVINSANDTVLRAKRPDVSSSPLSLRVLSTVHIAVATIFAALWLLMSKAVQRTTDFPAFLAGWNLFVNGHADQLYDLGAQKAVQQQLIGGSFANGVLPFVNPPYVATLFGALGKLSLGVGYWVWAAMNVGLLVVLFSLLHRIVRLETKQWRRFALWAVGVAPVWSTLMGGTFSLWVCVGLAGFVLAMQEDREVSAGAWLGLVAFKPQYLPAIVVLLIARRKWRALGGFAGAMAALLAVSLPWVGVDGYHKFLSLLLSFSNEGAKYSAHSELMWNVRGLLTRLIERGTLSAANSDSWLVLKHDALTSRIALALFVCGLIGVFWARRFPLRIHLALMICVMVILSPHGHVHDTILMLVAVGLAWSVASNSDRLSNRVQTLLGASSLPLTVAFFSSREALSLLALGTYLAITFWIWTLRMAESTERTTGHGKQEVPSGLECSSSFRTKILS
jgi:Glycosyltransferase family 87